jgi:hypothetical protein
MKELNTNDPTSRQHRSEIEDERTRTYIREAEPFPIVTIACEPIPKHSQQTHAGLASVCANLPTHNSAILQGSKS